MTTNSTANDVAKWMLLELEKKKELYQEDAVDEIGQRFGNKYVYDNDNGNPAIDKKVLGAFRQISGEDVVWSRSERYWRYRENSDKPGRNQD